MSPLRFQMDGTIQHLPSTELPILLKLITLSNKIHSFTEGFVIIYYKLT